MVVLGGGAVSYERGSPVPTYRQGYLARVTGTLLGPTHGLSTWMALMYPGTLYTPASLAESHVSIASLCLTTQRATKGFSGSESPSFRYLIRRNPSFVPTDCLP